MGILIKTPHIKVEISDDRKSDEFINKFCGHCQKFNHTSQECYYKENPIKRKEKTS